MTSFNPNYCGQFHREHKTHMIDVDADGNAVCSRPGCHHQANVACSCRVDPDWTKYIGCPTHTENPRIPYPQRVEYGSPSLLRAIAPWFPEDEGGSLTREQADHLARELRHRPR